MKKTIVLCLFLFITSWSLYASDRALIAVVDLEYHASHSKWFYRIEGDVATNLIKNKTVSKYQHVTILNRAEATSENFLKELVKLQFQDNISKVDVIFYIHGHGPNSPEGRSLCFYGAPCIPIERFSESIRDINFNNKLGVLYSDACWGSTHLDSMIEAGFMVAAGSTKVDANQTSDLRRFLKYWLNGKSFKAAIDFANQNPLTKLKDSIIKNASSIKLVKGNDSISF